MAGFRGSTGTAPDPKAEDDPAPDSVPSHGTSDASEDGPRAGADPSPSPSTVPLRDDGEIPSGVSAVGVGWGAGACTELMALRDAPPVRRCLFFGQPDVEQKRWEWPPSTGCGFGGVGGVGRFTVTKFETQHKGNYIAVSSKLTLLCVSGETDTVRTSPGDALGQISQECEWCLQHIILCCVYVTVCVVLCCVCCGCGAVGAAWCRAVRCGIVVYNMLCCLVLCCIVSSIG